MSGVLKLSNGKSTSNLLVDNPSSLSGNWMMKVSHVNPGYSSAGSTQFHSLAQDSNGDIFVYAQMMNNSSSGQTAVVTKYTKTGLKLWSKTLIVNYSPTSSQVYSAKDVVVDASNNVYCLQDQNLHKLSGTDGSIQWSRQIANNSLVARKLGMDSSSNPHIFGTIAVGTGDSHFAIKYNSSGTVLWQFSYDYGNQEQCFGGTVDTSGNVYTCGYTTNAPNAGYVKLTSAGGYTNGTNYTNAAVGGTGYFYNMVADSSGNLYFAGYNNVLASSQAAGQIMKTNSSGVRSWNRQLRYGTGNAYLYDVAVDASGNVYGVGSCTTTVGTDLISPVIAKWDSAGTLLWQREIIPPSTGSQVSSYIDSIIMDRTDSAYFFVSYKFKDAIDGATKHLIARLPVDGSKTGSYRIKVTDNDIQTIVYQAASNTESVGMWTTTNAHGALSGSSTSVIASNTYTALPQDTVQLVYGKASV